MIVLIDNYDSFSYNLYQLVGTINPDITVIRNDQMTVEELEKMNPDHIILSPGPGRPEQAGICEEVVTYFKGKVPILGVCLGHQAICEALGGKVTYAEHLMHGKQSEVSVDTKSQIFLELPEKMKVARYHSLIASQDEFSEELRVTATTEQNEIMAVEHKQYPVYGLQFHPESIMTEDGKKMMENFLAVTI